MTARRSRFLKIIAALGLTAVIVGAMVQGVTTLSRASLTAAPLPSAVSRTATEYRQEWDSLLAWKRGMYHGRVKPSVETFLPPGIKLPNLPP
jgi:hypothetical protein